MKFIIASRVGAKKEGVDIHTFFTINMNPYIIPLGLKSYRIPFLLELQRIRRPD